MANLLHLGIKNKRVLFVLRSIFRNFACRIKYKMMNELPQDPMMLYSAVNMKLRDRYNSLDELCDDLGIDRRELERRLAEVGFEYSVKDNKFW